jgi:hypothetical protein
MADGPHGGKHQPSASEVAERQILLAASEKLKAHRVLTAREQSAVKRWEKEKEERLRWEYYSAIPQKHWLKMSGRQAKVVNEQAVRYGLPFAGATIDLRRLAHALHDFLAANAIKLSREDDPLLEGGATPALERYREERATLARLDRMEREKQLIPRDGVRQALGKIAGILRAAGESLQRQYGQQAKDLLDEALDDAAQEVERAFGLLDPVAEVRAATKPEGTDAQPAP